MEELNELNDIILNKSGLRSGRRKWLLIIVLLTVILVAIVVGMRSLKSDDIQKALQSFLPPEPNAPTEVITNPSVKPEKRVENNTSSMVAPAVDNQPKEVIQAQPEVIPSLQEKPLTPSAPKEILDETPTKTIIQPAPIAKAPEKKSDVEKKAPQKALAVEKKPQIIAEKPKEESKKESPKKEPLKKEEPKKETKLTVQPKKVTPEVKTPAPVKKVSDPKLTEKVTPKETSSNGDTTIYYIQVGSFSKEPNPTLLDHLNASGLHYTTRKVGDMTKLLVGPYQGEEAAKEGLINVRQNVEAQAFRVK